MRNLRTWMSLAAVGGFLAVAFGAFAAHGIADPKAQAWMHTGATYAFMHTLAVFAAAFVASQGGRRARFAPPLFLAGVVIFSGSLFAMALGAPRWKVSTAVTLRAVRGGVVTGVLLAVARMITPISVP